MNEDGRGGALWDALVVGEELPSYEYVLTEEMVGGYRKVVDNPGALFPTVAARHPDHCFRLHYEGQMWLPNAGYDNEYFNAPIPGKRITVTGRIADKYIRRGKAYIVVEATATDEDGRLIETNRLVALAAEAGTPPLAEVARKWER